MGSTPIRPTKEQILAALRYEPVTGKLYHRKSVRRRKAGDEAGFIKPGSPGNGGGYRILTINRIRCRAHHVVWFLETGFWPISEIDHENGVRADNRFEKLRPATVAQNRTNRRIQSNNKCGFKWVSFHPQSGKWRAEVRMEGKRVHDSLHPTPNAAYLAAYGAAQVAHGIFFNSGQ